MRFYGKGKIEGEANRFMGEKLSFREVERLTGKKIQESIKIASEDAELFPRPYMIKHFPLAVERASGSRVWDADGNEYVDFTSGAAVFNVGHSNPKVIKSMLEQAERALNFSTLYFYMHPPLALAKKLVSITPGTFEKRVLFSFDGAEAAEMALIASRAYRRRGKIISFRGSFHGSLYLSLSSSGILSEGIRRDLLLYDGVLFSEYPDPYRNKWGIDGYERPEDLMNESLKELEGIVEKGGKDVAALIMEPIQGDGGIIVPPDGFVKEVRRIASENGITFIDDDIQTGMGRTGRWWGIEHFGVEPDMLIAGKALGGGMPISAIVSRAEILESIPGTGLGTTNMGHAVSAKAAYAAIEEIEKENLIARAEDMGRYVLKRLKEMSEAIEIIGDVRGIGMLAGVEIVRERKDKRPGREEALKICWKGWEKGLIVSTVGKYGNVIRIAPPLNIPKEDLEKGLDALEESMREVSKGEVPDEVLKFMQGW
jgi:4-aminobutyrate aminotransferase